MSTQVLKNGDPKESLTVKQFLYNRCTMSTLFSQIPDNGKEAPPEEDPTTTKPEVPEEISLHNIPAAENPPAKSAFKRPAPKDAADNQEESTKKSKADTPSTSNRYENSLLLTTQRFMMLKQITRDKILNLNDAADFLEVPKRRLYDITNVLEGIAIVEKIGKNAIRWRDEVPDHLKQQQLEEDVELLKKQESDIDSLIQDCKSLFKLVSEDPIDTPYAYIQRSEVRHLDELHGTASIAIKSAPPGVNNIEIQVADPYMTGGYQMIARNKSGAQLGAYLCMYNDAEYASFEPSLTKSDSSKEILETIVKQEIIEEEEVEQGTSEPPKEVKIEPVDDYIVPVESRKPEPIFSQKIETPGRGLYMSPLKPLLDPSVLMPGAPSSSQSGGFIPIELPASPPMRPWNNMEAPPSLLELFPNDEDFF